MKNLLLTMKSCLCLQIRKQGNIKLITKLLICIAISSSVFFSATNAYAKGTIFQWSFILDTSLQNYTVQVDAPQFPTGPKYNFQNYIKCDAYDNGISKGSPLLITGMDRGVYSCTQESTLDLPSGTSYILIASINITVNNQTLKIDNLDYRYDPWDVKAYEPAFLLYLNSAGKLSYRRI
jgi:hypothetical protein